MTPGAHGKARGPGLQGRGWGGRNVPVEALFVRNIASNPCVVVKRAYCELAYGMIAC